MFFSKVQNHLRFRLSARAIHVWFVWAVGNIVNDCTELRQIRFHSDMYGTQRIFLHITESDAALVGHDKNLKFHVVEQLNRLSNTVQQVKIAWLVDEFHPIAEHFVNHPVTVEKHRLVHAITSYRSEERRVGTD